MLGHINTAERKLYGMTPAGTQVLASASPNFEGKYRWISQIWQRSGRKNFNTIEEALTAAAKSFGVTVCDIRN